MRLEDFRVGSRYLYSGNPMLPNWSLVVECIRTRTTGAPDFKIVENMGHTHYKVDEQIIFGRLEYLTTWVDENAVQIEGDDDDDCI